MSLPLTSLLLLVLIAGARADWLNDWKQPLHFECPPGEHMANWKSIYDNHKDDRRWDLKCKPGFVIDDCRWSDDANYYGQVDFEFKCPDDRPIITGATSTFDDHKDDRKWQFKCCALSTKPGERCFKTSDLNLVKEKDKPNYTVKDEEAITGIIGHYVSKHDDRSFKVTACKFATCLAKKITILEDIPASLVGIRNVGLVTMQGCSKDTKYSLSLTTTDSLTKTSSISITNGKTYSYSSEVSLNVGASAEFAGVTGSIEMGVSNTVGHEVSAERSETQETSTGIENSAGSSIGFDGPGSSILLGNVKQYEINMDAVKVRVDVECDDGSAFSEEKMMKFTSTSYGETMFGSRTAIFNSQDQCTIETEECAQNIDGHTLIEPTTIYDQFQKCFPEGVVPRKLPLP